METSRFWNVKDVAEFLNLSKASIYRLTSQKQIPHIKIHGKLLFNSEKIKEWADSFTVKLGIAL